MEIKSIYAVIDAWAEALLADAGLDDWADGAFGRGVTVYTGMDLAELPGRDDCPCVLLLPSGDSTGLMVGDMTYTVRLVCTVDVKRGGRSEDGGQVDYSALRTLATQFVPRVLNSLAGTDYKPERVDGEWRFEDYPLVQQGMNITVTDYGVLGSPRAWAVG